MLAIRTSPGRPVGILVVLLVVCANLTGQAPAGYYSTVDATSSATLRATLHDVIDDHTRFPYTSSSTDTWDILEAADEDPSNSSNILDVYRNASYAKQGGGSGAYNREHTWPKSYGFPNDTGSNYPYTDCHQLYLCDSGYNTSRSNKPFGYCNAGCTEKTTLSNNGAGGGSGPYPGNSNWTEGSFTQGTWEAWIDRRGDIARAMFYLAIRYEGGTHGATSASEPDLVLTDSQSLISQSNTGSNESVAYMGYLSDLLQWHLEDPVDAVELARNDAVFAFQGNRNPFADHPEWVDCIWGSGSCGTGSTAPAAPAGVAAVPGDGYVDLTWLANGEPDLDGYNVYRAPASGGPYALLIALGTVTAFTDSSVANGSTYYYVVTAENTSDDESAASMEVFAMPTGGGGSASTVPWINEIHYDNSGADTGEFVEIAGPAGLDLAGWEIVGYNGNGGSVYVTVSVSGVIPNQQNCLGTLSFFISGLQNGAPDGIALVDPQGVVTEFVSYEGSFTANGGPAGGMTSNNIGVSEGSSTPSGFSLQLGGSGGAAADFNWQTPQSDSPGLPNAGQTLTGGCALPPSAPTGLFASASDGLVSLGWNPNPEPTIDGYDVHRATVSGGPYVTVANLGPVTSWNDGTVLNGTTYFYVVTAVDTAAASSGFSAEMSALPLDVTAPAAPLSLVAMGGTNKVVLDWADGTEPDLLGYHVYRSTSPGGPYTVLTTSPIGNSSFVDTLTALGTTYFYVATAVDIAGNESVMSNESIGTEGMTFRPGSASMQSCR